MVSSAQKMSATKRSLAVTTCPFLISNAISNPTLSASRKLQLGCRSLRVPPARRFAVDAGNVLVRNLAAARLRSFHLHLRRLAGLLMNFLVRRRLVFDEQFGRRVGFEIQHLRFRGNAVVHLVQDCAAEFEPL